MNTELYDKANAELDKLLKKCPELLETQSEISYTLAMMDDPIARCIHTQEVMLDKLYELRYLLEELNESYNRLFPKAIRNENREV